MTPITIDPRDVDTRACTRALRTVPRTTYDCIQSNLALLADAAGGTGAARLLGAHLVVRPRPLADGLLTVDPPPDDEVGRCAGLLGLTATAGPEPVSGARVEAAVRAAGSTCYAVGDAFDMPWLPYFRHAHMPHSFLIGPAAADAGACVVDAYDNRTEWGAAEPGSWTIPWTELSFPMRLWTWTLTAARGPDPALVERYDVPAYVEAYRVHEDRARAWEQLTVETWLLARRHRLFAYGQAGDPVRGQRAADVAAEWEALAADVFVYARRVRRGGRESTAAIDETGRLLTTPL